MIYVFELLCHNEPLIRHGKHVVELCVQKVCVCISDCCPWRQSAPRYSITVFYCKWRWSNVYTVFLGTPETRDTAPPLLIKYAARSLCLPGCNSQPRLESTLVSKTFTGETSQKKLHKPRTYRKCVLMTHGYDMIHFLHLLIKALESKVVTWYNTKWKVSWG